MDKINYLIRIIAFVLLATVLVFGAAMADHEVKTSIPVKGKSKSVYPELAKISMMDAEKKAQEKYPGKIIKVELEEEDEYLVYKVEVVRVDKSVMEVSVDPGTGEVLYAEREEDRED